MVAQSPEPGAHVLNARAFRIELEFRNVGFCGEGKTGVPGEKPLGAEKRTNNKLNPHVTSSPGIEPGPHWWKASALTTAPSLLSFQSSLILFAYNLMVGYSKKNKNIIRKSVFDKRKKKPGFEQLGPGSKTLFTWSGGPRSSGVGFFCFVSPRA